MSTTYLGYTSINIFALRMVDYGPTPRIQLMHGDVIVHEHHYVLFLEPTLFQYLVRMAHISLHTQPILYHIMSTCKANYPILHIKNCPSRGTSWSKALECWNLSEPYTWIVSWWTETHGPLIKLPGACSLSSQKNQPRGPPTACQVPVRCRCHLLLHPPSPLASEFPAPPSP